MQITDALKALWDSNTNDYVAVVFLFLPNGDTTQIETVVSSNDTTLRTNNVEGVMKKIATSSDSDEFRNLQATVMEEGRPKLHGLYMIKCL